jgi:hypothetical protein
MHFFFSDVGSRILYIDYRNQIKSIFALIKNNPNLGNKRNGYFFYFLVLSKLWYGAFQSLIFFFTVYSFICMCIHSLGHLSSLLPPPPAPLASRKNLFCPLLQFCWQENITDNKKNVAFLLAWDKDSYTDRFLALLPCTSVLQPELAHLYLTSSLLPSHLPILIFASLRLLH